MYSKCVPKLWTETIDAHRRQVRDAVLDTTADLVANEGLLSVTMSHIADRTGIGRATLYKYFSSVEDILVAWHRRQITNHLEHLAEVSGHSGNAGERLEAVLEAFALISHGSHQSHGTEMTALLHRDESVGRAQQEVTDVFRELLTEAAASGVVRNDVTPEELASYCLHALTAARDLPSKEAVRRLVTVVMTGLAPPR